MPSSYSSSSIFDTPDFDTASTSSSLSSFDSFSTDPSSNVPANELNFYGIGDWTDDKLFNDWCSAGSFDGLNGSTGNSIKTAELEVNFCRYENAFANFFSA